MLKKIEIILLVIGLQINAFGGVYIYEFPSSDSYTEAQVQAALTAACSGDCTGGESTDDVLYLIVPTGIDVRVAPDEADWDLTSFTTIVIDIQGTGTITIPKKSEIFLSATSSLIVGPSADFIAENNGNTLISFGGTSFNGADFPDIVADGGASASGSGVIPAVYGNDEWIVMCYSGSSFDTYEGSYVETNLAFDTEDRWTSGTTPSNASGYTGNAIANDNHSYSYNRTGFPCGTYSLDIPSHDDGVALYVDGVLEYTHIGCCDSHTDVWTGYLNSTSTIEFRISENGGGSYGSMDFNLTEAIAIDQACGSGDQTITVSGVTGATWAPATDLNTTSGNTVITSATSAIVYTVSGTSLCDGSAYSEDINIYADADVDYGNEEWVVFAYSDRYFTTYAGYYVDDNVSVNTENSWVNSPDDADGYQGCVIGNDNHSYRYKREGFDCGEYTIDRDKHDDECGVIIDGDTVYYNNSYTTVAQADIWTGFLGPNSKVELFTGENGGISRTIFNFTKNNSLPGVHAFEEYVCGSGSKTLRVAGLTGVTWTPTTNLNVSTGNEVVATPTVETVYTASGTSLCDASTITADFNLYVDQDADYGNEEWVVFCYNDRYFTDYAGFYIDENVSVDTRNYWWTSPDDAQNYQGCIIGNDNHSYRFKRKGFDCGEYSIARVSHDDECGIIIDGDTVYYVTGSPGTALAVWTGFLGPNSEVEVFTGEGGGGSNTRFTFTKNNSLTDINVVQGIFCGVASQTLRVAGLTGVTWTPTTGLNVSTGNEVIATPAENTVYTASGTSLCDASAIDTTFTLYVAPDADYGNDEWVVFCYSDGNFTDYAGFYTDTDLSVNTEAKWVNSPDDASNYQGCTIGNDNHSYRYKREGFDCGEYTIDRVKHDDECGIIIDGDTVYYYAGWTGASQANVWTGFLGPNSTVEFFTEEGGGGSNTVFTFTQNNSLAGVHAFEEYVCGAGSKTLRVAGLTGVTWSPTTNLNVSTGNVVVATPTVETVYTASGTSLCDASTITADFNLYVDQDTDYGNEEWVVFCYNDRYFTDYAGFYIDENLSVDTRNYWWTSPDDASNYQGCVIGNDNHSYRFKRVGFDCGEYSIARISHDDECGIVIDGDTVYYVTGSPGTALAVWTGFLGPNSTVEVFTGEGGGGSNTRFTFTQNNSITGINAIQGYSCGSGSQTLRVSGLTGVTWTPTTGLNVSTGNEVIASPTNDVTYTASGTSLCDASTIDTTFSVYVAPDADYGNEEWVVFCYSDGDFADYAGFYIDNNLSVNTETYWVNSPDDASNYKGCTIGNDNHSYRYKREGFDCGEYTIDRVKHDDECGIVIDGDTVYYYAGWTGAAQADVWTGFLGPNSMVEIFTQEGGGGSNTVFTFTQNNSLAGLNAVQIYTCGSGSQTLRVAGLSGVTWSPTTDLNVSVGNEVIASPSEQITYTASGTSLCDASAMDTTFTIYVDQDTDYGDEEWVVFCYSDRYFTDYAGFYIDENLSVDTRNYWWTSPDDAPNYQGCVIGNDNHSYRFKRVGFDCGQYSIDRISHDDECGIVVDGDTVYYVTGSPGTAFNAWTGFLGPNSTVEVFTGEGGGGSNTRFTFTYLNNGGPVTGEKVWNGLADTDWFNDGNWCPSAPTLASDNIIISKNAPNYPVINSAIEFTNIQFKNGADFTINNGVSIDVYGDWNDEGSVVTVDGEVRFVGTVTQTITGNDTWFKDVELDNTAGFVISGDLVIDGALTMTNGIITSTTTDLLTITENGSITGYSATNYVDGPLAKIGDTDFVFPLADGGVYSPLVITNITSSSTFKAEYFSTAPSNGSSLTGLNNVSAMEYWDLDRTAGTGAVNVELFWSRAGKSGIDDLADLVVAHYDATNNWVSEGNTATTGTGISGSGSVTSGQVSTFSPFTFGSLGNANNPLPVELITFNGVRNSNDVHLSWATASEKNNDYFSIERSENGIDFLEVGAVNGSGNSNVLIEYNFVDEGVIGDLIYYRLKQVDYDGAVEYSDIISMDQNNVASSISAPSLFIYPNPKGRSEELYVVLNNIEGVVHVEISSLKGESISVQSIEVTNGLSQKIVPFDLSIKKGVYVVKVISAAYSGVVQLIVE